MKKLSKFLSLILRHKPEHIGLELDDHGWALIDDLLDKAGNPELTRELLYEIVTTNDKQRFIISEDGSRIRANQGHSIKVDLGLQELKPPNILYHGTADRFVDSIFEKGLIKKQRHHVHLSEQIKTAEAVGKRYGKLVLLKIDAEKMYSKGFKFYKSENEVWLVDTVPSEYLSKHN